MYNFCSERSVDQPEPYDTVIIKLPDTLEVPMDTLPSLSELAFIRNIAIGKGTSFLISQFEGRKFSWNYFDFGVLFKAYDLESNQWIEGFENAFFGE